jgi:hypothetical protein
MQYQISKVEKIIGLFVILAAVLIAAFLIFSIKEGKIFKKKIILVTTADKGYGFVKGTIVKVKDIAAGMVEDIRLDTNNTVIIKMSIPKPFYENIHKDAIAEIIEPLAFGSSEINILPGSASEPTVEDGDFIASRIPESLSSRIESSFNKIEATISEFEKTAEAIRKTAVNLESITSKIDRGEGSLGKLVNDPELYDTAKDAVESTRNIVEGIKATKIFVGGDLNYYYHQDVAVARFHLRIVPRESRYFWLGGAIFNPASTSDITMEEDSERNYRVFPEFIVAQKIFSNRITLRAGLIEGKFGGGVDYALQKKEKEIVDGKPKDKINDLLLFSIEGRTTYDTEKFDEHLDKALLRAKVRVKVFKYFNLEFGGDNLLNDPGFLVGFGFEYMDDDISKIVGLIGAGK